MGIAINRSVAVRRTTMTHWKMWAALASGLVLWALLLSMVVYQFRAGWMLQLGQYYDTLYVQSGFSERETIQDTAQTFRWTDGAARIYVPRVGRGAWSLALHTATLHPDGSPVNARLVLPGGVELALPDQVEPRTFVMFVPPAAMTSGDFDVRLFSEVYQETTASARQLGIPVFGMQAAPVGARPILPPSGTLILLMLIMAGAGLTLVAAGVRVMLAAGVAAALGAGLMLPLIQSRVPYSFWLPGLAVLAGVSLVLVLLLRSLVPRLMRSGGVEIDRGALSALLVLFVAGVWIKGGGQLYPYMIAIDIHWHMDKVRDILNGGLADIYTPGSFSESVMPASEWGEDRPTIPYSPFFHIFATSFAVFPWQLETTAKIFSTVVDLSRVFLIFFLARSFGMSRRGGLLAAAAYTVFPVTYLLHSWGNVPTTFGLWWILLSSAVIVALWGQLHRWRSTLLLAAVLIPTFLFYTVTGVFMGIILIALMGAIGVLKREQRRQVRGLLGATALAVAGAIGVYYWQFVADILQKTLPYFSQTLTEGQESVGATPFEESWSHYLGTYPLRLWDYGLLIPLLLLPFAWWLLVRHDDPQVVEATPKRWLAPFWIGSIVFLGIVFVPLGRMIPMVDKHLFIQIPVLALGIGLVFDWSLRWLEQRRIVFGGIIGIAAFYGLMLLAAINLWMFRIGYVKQEW